MNGHREFKIAVKEKGSNSEKWAYAPYLTVANAQVGPLVSFLLHWLAFTYLIFYLQDLVPVPVNREDCRNDDSTENENGMSSISYFFCWISLSP